MKTQNIRKLKSYKNLYECKCKFFWEQYLGFRFETEFDKEIKNEFNKCPSRCGLCQKFNETTFCDLGLWHPEKEHNFSCSHNKSIPYHTIFIIDKSDSMGSVDIKPTYQKICNNLDFNNRLGCVVQAINNYIKKRIEINKNDVFSLVSFSTDATINFIDYNIDELSIIDFIEECMGLIGEAKGNTYFQKGFREAEKILLGIDKKKYNPLIILLSDGEDCEPNKTISYVKEVSFYYIKIILII